MRILGIIPARGGSKGVRRKNLRRVGGEPLVSHAIRAGQAARRLTHLVVSTEDEEIANAAKRLGCEVVPRPSQLASDDAPMVPVAQHALAMVEAAQGRMDAVAVLQPTTPLRTSEDIDGALEVLERTGADSVVSVYQVEDQHPARMYRLTDGRLVPYASEPSDGLRQSLDVLFHRNGAIYVCRRAVLTEGHGLLGQDLRAWVMPRERSLNIDDEHDLLMADLLLQHLRATGAVAEVARAHPQR